jgi:hypothetical protein
LLQDLMPIRLCLKSLTRGQIITFLLQTTFADNVASFD